MLNRTRHCCSAVFVNRREKKKKKKMLKQEKQWSWEHSWESSSPLPQGKGVVSISENRIRWPLTTKKMRERSCPEKIQLTFSLSSLFSCWLVSDPLRPHGLQHTPGFPALHHLPEFAQTHVRWVAQTHVRGVGEAIQPSHPLSSPSLPAFNLSQHQGLFKWVTVRIRWLKYWSFSFNISPSNEHPGLISSFRMDWLDLLAVQGTLKSLLQHHSSKAAILWCSAFIIISYEFLFSSFVLCHSFWLGFGLWNLH